MLVEGRILPNACSHPIELRGREILSIRDDANHRTRVRNVSQGIRAKDDDIRNATLLHAPEIVRFAKEAGSIDRRGLQCFERRESGGDKSLKLLVETDARCHPHAGRRVGPGEERYRQISR